MGIGDEGKRGIWYLHGERDDEWKGAGEGVKVKVKGSTGTQEHLRPELNLIWNHTRLPDIQTPSGGICRMQGSSDSALAQHPGGDKVKDDGGKR